MKNQDKKGDGKGRSSHKSSEKTGSKMEHTRRTSSAITETAQLTIDDGLPNNFQFLYRIDELQIVHNDDPGDRLCRPGTSAIKNDKALYWFPPNRKNGFSSTKGKLYRWQKEKTTLIDQNISFDLKAYSTTSVCFQARQDNFMAAATDCSQFDVKGLAPEPGWCQIMFHPNEENRNMSEVDFIARESGLVAPAKGSTWMPQVVPEVYNYDTKSPNSFTRHHPPNVGLCGKLGIIFGMAAFSAPVSAAEDIVARCFRFGKWEKHGLEDGAGRYQDRGVVVTIFLDPTAKGITDQHLKAFEDGKYGPIFEGQSREYIFEPSSAPRAGFPSDVSVYPTSSIPRYPNYGLAGQGNQGYQMSTSQFPGSQGLGYVTTDSRSGVQNYGAQATAGTSYAGTSYASYRQQDMGDMQDEENEEPDIYASGSQYQSKGAGGERKFQY